MIDSECEGPCLPHCYSENLFIGILLGILIGIILFMVYQNIKK